ncbi:MAG: exo-alpha-sialidase [Planctomycetes bacterium]|nr:exo-alpha-sialidase [Planctomycetota bacterium]
MTTGRTRALTAIALALATLLASNCMSLDLHDRTRFEERSLTLVDLAHDAERRSVVDHESGQYLGHPTTVLLDDGKTLLCAYPEGHGRGAIRVKRSTDGGRTWSERRPVPASFATSLETPTLFRIATQSGEKRLLLFSGLFPARLSTSDDDGEHFTELAPIGAFGGIVVMSSLARLADGELAAWFHDDGRFFHAGGSATGTFTLYETRSSDDGTTWSTPRALWSGSDLHLCEPGVVRSPDGKELALFLRENRRVAPSQVITSRDEGVTWSAPRSLAWTLTGDRHVARYAPDGRLVVTFRDTAEGSPWRGDWVLWVGTYADALDGREGELRVRLADNVDAWDCGYAGLELLADGTFAATSYGHWAAGLAPWVICVRFRLDELDRRARGASAPH